jgi:chemotaxis protein MotB
VVRAILEDKGIAPNRVRAVSYGDTLPLVPTLNPDSPALNRRVEFYFHRADVMNSRVVN